MPVSLHYQICIFTLLNTCIRFIVHAFFRCQICVYSFSNLCFSVTESVHLFHQIRVFTLSKTHIFVIAHVCFTSSNLYFRLPLRVCVRICGRDKSDPYGCERFAKMLLTVCDNATNTNEIHTKHSAKYQQTFREIPTLTHEMGCEHSVRRRGRFIAPVS